MMEILQSVSNFMVASAQPHIYVWDFDESPHLGYVWKRSIDRRRRRAVYGDHRHVDRPVGAGNVMTVVAFLNFNAQRSRVVLFDEKHRRSRVV
ncbi:hypothetical protein B7767_04465 [Streptomyces sp. 13-12-16]|nr:hypothetical protein B7767_04465 [Streptomyces sp. 13-12-16]